MIFMGIDASMSCTGICIFNDKKLIHYDKIKPISKGDFRHNACEIIEQVLDIAKEHNPDIIYMEDVPKFARGGNILKPLITLGGLQGIFYYELVYKNGFNIRYVDVYEWRQKLDFLKGERKRDAQKSKAIKYVNELFGLDLYYVEGKKSVKDDDDIAEAICICVSMLQ